jgi:transposase
LRKWWRRYQKDGVAGLKDESRRPHHLAKRKIFADQEALILDLRRSRRLGIKQLRSELLRQHGLGLSLDTLHRILVRHGEQHLKR